MSTYAIDREKWAKLTLFEQMGNIGSEVGRSFNAKRQHDNDKQEQAMIRALDLLDATIELLSHSPSRQREVLRARENYLEELSNDKPDSPENYFMQFAIASRLDR